MFSKVGGFHPLPEKICPNTNAYQQPTSSGTHRHPLDMPVTRPLPPRTPPPVPGTVLPVRGTVRLVRASILGVVQLGTVLNLQVIGELNSLNESVDLRLPAVFREFRHALEGYIVLGERSP